jgi:hypothetical protein
LRPDFREFGSVLDIVANEGSCLRANASRVPAVTNEQNKPGDEKDIDEREDDEREDEDEDEDDEDDAEPSSRRAPSAAAAKSKTESRAAATRPAKRAVEARRSAGNQPVTLSPLARGILFAVVGLAVGVGAGWFLGDARAKGRAPFARPAPTGSAVTGECKTWQDKICAESGATSAGCAQAKMAAELMPSAACNVALADVSSTLGQLKKAREICVNLANKLCTDLGKESQTCQLVQSKTQQMAPANCRQMEANYAAVLGQLKMMEQQGGMMMGGPRAGGMRPSMPPPGHPPPGQPAPP